MLQGVTYQASGNISPSRFVAIVPNNDFTVFQVATVATDIPVGISEMGTQTFDTAYAATDGYLVKVHGPGEVGCLLELGGTVSAGQYIISDTSGKGVAASLTATANQLFGAEALENGVSGNLIKVRVVKFAGVQSN